MMSSPSFIIHTGSLSKSDLTHRLHPLDPSVERYQLPIGDNTGLSKTGVHLCRIEPNRTSTVLHWHSNEDEWSYIIDAGENAVLLLKEGEGAETTEIKLTKGDFIGFPAGVKNAHAFRSGDSDLVYLIGGSREPSDVCSYPELGRKMIINGSGPRWVVDECNIKVL